MHALLNNVWAAQTPGEGGRRKEVPACRRDVGEPSSEPGLCLALQGPGGVCPRDQVSWRGQLLYGHIFPQDSRSMDGKVRAAVWTFLVGPLGWERERAHGEGVKEYWLVGMDIGPLNLWLPFSGNDQEVVCG